MPRTLEEIEAFAQIDPEFAQAVKSAPPLPNITEYAPQDIRLGAKAFAQQFAEANPVDPASILIENITIPARDQYPIPARLYKPATSVTGQSPLVVIFHGGGYVLGGPENEELACRSYVKELGVVVVNVDYRLAPEFPFPVGPNDAWDSVKWVS